MKILWLLLAAPLMAQELAFDAADFLKWPEHIHGGEMAGVATRANGNVLVYTRTGTQATVGGSRVFTHGGSRLFEFDRTGKFVRELGEGAYGFEFAQSVKVDPGDNVWVVDRGSSMVLKFDPAGRVAMTLGRKPEAVAEPGRGGGGGRGGNGAGVPGDNFNRPTDVAWDSAGNIYVADGFGNARIAKFDPNGKFLKSWGTRGAAPGQFDMPLSIAIAAANHVYVADHGNRRIQVFDVEGAFEKELPGHGAPWAICISPGAHPYLFMSNSNAPNTLDGGEIYKMELDGKVAGVFGRAGKRLKEFGTVNQIDCRNPNQLLIGETQNWRVQRLTLK
jgi:DNA-binding beta-propeller fold protein YncE